MSKIAAVEAKADPALANDLPAGTAQRRYWQSVATLASGSFASQVVGILSMLVLARIYAPEEFGSYTLFFTIAGLLSLVATAKYDGAVFLARRTSEAAELAMLAAAISGVVGLVILAFAPFADLMLSGVTKRPSLFVVLLAAATTSGGVMASAVAWATQIQAFGAITVARLAQAAIGAIVSITLGLVHWDATGLILGFVGGQVAISAYLVVRLGFIAHVRRFTLRAARVRAQRNISFPKFLLASELLNYLGGNLFAFVTPPLFGPAALGQYSLGFRLAALPINLISFSMGSVFRAAISPQHIAPAEIPALFRATFYRLCGAGLLFTVPLLLAGPQLFRIAFGPQWEPAGLYVQILAPYMLVRFVVGPLTAIAIRAGRQRLDTMLQAMFVVASVLAIGFGAWTTSFTAMLVAFSVLQSLVYLAYLAIGYRLALQLAHPAKTHAA
jgi:O-antigen/teichoic acid export membrane protein